MWTIIITSNNDLSNRDKDFIADLIDNEAHTVIAEYSFILHDILEAKKSCEAIIEGNERSVKNLVDMLKSNIQYHITYKTLDT